MQDVLKGYPVIPSIPDIWPVLVQFRYALILLLKVSTSGNPSTQIPDNIWVVALKITWSLISILKIRIEYIHSPIFFNWQVGALTSQLY